MEKLVGRYTFVEEILNASTHGLGILLSIVGLSVLIAFAALNGSVMLIVSCAIFGAALIFAYTFSTLYHAITNEKAKQMFRKFDHASIYFLIAGTYTPIALVVLKGVWGWSIFGVIWAVSIFGIVLEFVAFERFRKLSLVLYLLMGWFMVIATNQLIHNMASGGLWLLLAGGLSYSIGVIFYVWKKLPYNHAIWHLFVLGGSICHYFMVLFYIVE
ncbi:PAQR family membrane homeostasis protein TrhA [Sulfurospirillum sp. 1612]|uniref:PAQR family membrane homeostasis protein TrhA n=1 Tax=Sulfurospirillum sp. 1612 TaxID=3094835 RepID=UPI002F94D595